MIPYGRQDISQSDIDRVIEVLKSDFITQGPMVPEFESAVKSKVGAQYAVAVNSATSALHLACLSLGVGPGDTLWTTPITFVASANCARYCGASVDFVDIDPVTYNLSIDQLESKLVKAKKLNQLPKVLVAVHLCGQSCDMKKIRELSDRYHFYVIEDASHAIGGKFENRYIGSCIYSDITIFSFHPVKIITTAEGGMALTNDPTLARKLYTLRTHGITRKPEEMLGELDGPWYYEQVDLGFNYRLTDLQAALGLSQLERLDQFVEYRNQLAGCYDRLLGSLPVGLPHQDPVCYSSRHLYVIRLENQSKEVHRAVFERLLFEGIGVGLHYIPVYRQPYYQRLGFNVNKYPEAEKYYTEAISLPLYVGMTEEQQNKVIESITTAFILVGILDG